MAERPVAPNKRFLRAVRDERVHVHVYDHATRGQTWRSYPFGLWFVIKHEEAGYTQPLVTARWAGIPPIMRREPGLAVKLTALGEEYLKELP